METTITVDGQTLTAALAGDMEITGIEGFKNTMHAHLAGDINAVHIQAHGLTYIDSTGLGALVSVLKSVREKGGGVKITGLKPHLYKLFEITALNQLFEIEVSDEQR